MQVRADEAVMVGVDHTGRSAVPADMSRWEDVLRPRGWTPEFRRWMALPRV